MTGQSLHLYFCSQAKALGPRVRIVFPCKLGLLHRQSGVPFTHRQQSQCSLRCWYRSYAWTLLCVVCKATPLHIRHHLTACVTSMDIIDIYNDCNLLCIVLQQRACQCMVAEHTYNLVTIHHFWSGGLIQLAVSKVHALLILMLSSCPSTCTFEALSLAAPDVH